MPSNHTAPQTGALLTSSPFAVNRRVIGALLIRELLTRYGRNNIGFLWLFVEPAAFILIVTFVWTVIRGVHISNIPIVAFALTGYSSMLMWRYTAGRCIGAIKSNKSLLYHRQVTITDIFVARITLEILAMTAALVVLSILFYAIGWLTLPEDVLKLLWGWLLLSWLSAGLGLTMGGLSEKADFVGRIWHPISYILMVVSGVAFTVDALPPGMQKVVLWVPMVNAVELIRDGWFGSDFNAHYDVPYLMACNVAMTIIGLSLVRRIGFDTSEE
jgi:ABC-2 type transport system permease protein/capsular polysaccharide transport system permease protein